MNVMKPFPTGMEKSQLWARIRDHDPELASTLDTFRKQYPGCTVKSFDFDGITYYDPYDPPPPPDKVYTLDESFLMRLSAADRQKYYYDIVNPPTAVDTAKALKTKKGKRK